MKPTPLFKEFSRYVILNVWGMIGLSCYILADTFFISKGLGSRGLAALNLAIPVYSFIHGAGLLLGMGGATKYSIFQGQKDKEHTDEVFSNVVCLALGMAALFMVTGIFLSGWITAMLKADGEVFQMTKTYLRIILLFSPAFLMNEVLICFVRNDGNPRLAMIAMLTGSLSNIVMDYLFIFPLGMGILGAVLATGFAPVISIGILSYHWITRQNHFHFRKFPISHKIAASVISLGLPSLIAELASGIVMIVFNVIILRLEGNVGVAAYGVVANLSLVVIAIYTGIAQGMQPIMSRFYGQGERGSVRQTLFYGVGLMILISVFLYLLFFLAAEQITEIFNSEHNLQLQKIAVMGLKLYFTAIPFAGFNIILATYFTSMERALPAQAVCLLRGFVIILPMAWFLSNFWSMTGVWLSFPVTEAIVAVAGLLFSLQNHLLSD